MEVNALSKEFASALDRISEVLTEEDVQVLANKCINIKPCRRRLIKTINELFAELQGRGIQHENMVNVLVTWMDMSNMNEASDILKDYRRRHLQTDEMCPKHKEEKLGYVCLTCCKQMCDACTVSSHNNSPNCKIVPVENMSQEIKNQRKRLSDKLERIKHNLVDLEGRCEERDILIKSRGNALREEIDCNYALLIGQVNLRKLKLLKRVTEMEISDTKVLLLVASQVEEAKDGLTWLRNVSPSLPNNDLPELMKISELESKVNKIAIELEETGNMCSKNDHLFYSSVYNHCKFSALISNPVVGSVLIKKNQLVKVIDNRLEKGGIYLVSSGVQDDSQSEHWRHLVLTEKHGFPIVIADKLGSINGKQCIILAVGKEIIIVRLCTNEQKYASVGSESATYCNELSDDSWITSISLSQAKYNSSDSLLIISISSSSVLRECKVSGDLVKTLDITNVVPYNNISYAVRSNDVIAMVACGRNDVILVRSDDEIPCHVGSLRSPSLRCNSPSIVTYTNNGQWLVLYVSRSEPNEWEVNLYDHSGEFARVCCASSSENNVKMVVGMTVIGKEGFVSLDNSSVQAFSL